MLRKPDSALALGLFEHYFKLEVRLPPVITRSSFPLSLSFFSSLFM
jgi:hypothetical protein